MSVLPRPRRASIAVIALVLSSFFLRGAGLDYLAGGAAGAAAGIAFALWRGWRA